MILRLCSVLCLLAAVPALELTDEQYYSMPRLYELDDFEECLAQRGTFCKGIFQLSSSQPSHLMDMIQEYSDTKYKFNYTVIHRAYCLNTTCSHIPRGSLSQVFGECIDTKIKNKYELDANLLELEYCTTEPTAPMEVDTYDLIFLGVTFLLIFANAAGTAYDLFRNKDNKPNKYLMTWSLRVNWALLVAVYDKKDARLTALNSVHGLKTLLLMLVVLAHSIIAHHMTYMHNPKFFEESMQKPHMTILNNGTAVVQTFIILSSFLLAYNVLLSLEKDHKKQIDFRFWWKIVMHRVIRITPLNFYVLGLAATWARGLGGVQSQGGTEGGGVTGGGPLWPSMVVSEAVRCRRQWWTHALYINNLVGEERCQIQTWFLATDMQLYIVSSVLLVLLVRRSRSAIPLLSALFILSVVANFCISYFFELSTIVFISEPKTISRQFFYVPSFRWLYTAPWFSLPSAALGLLLAFLYYQLTTSNYDLGKNRVFRACYALAVPSALLWLALAHWARACGGRTCSALYSALERPLYGLLLLLALVGFFYRIPNVFLSIFSWRGWRVPSRMSLAVLLLHWTYNLTTLAHDTQPARLSVYTIGQHWLGVLFMTYLTALPLHLMLELPAQKFLEAVFN